MARALFHAARGRGRTSSESRWSARSSCLPTAWSSGKDFTRAPASRTPKCTRSTTAGLTSARRDAVLHARAVLPHGPHGSRVSRESSTPASRASWRRSRIRIRSCAAAASPSCEREASTSTSGPVAAAAVLLNQPFFTLMREGRPFVTLKAAVSVDGCIAEAPGRRDRADVGRRQPPRARDSRGNRRDWRRRGDDSRRRSAADARGAYRERPLIRVVFDRHLRTPPARPRALDTSRQGLSSSDDGRRGRPGRTRDSRWRSAARRLDCHNRWHDSLRRCEPWAIAASPRCLLEGGAALHEAAWDEGVGRLRAVCM